MQLYQVTRPLHGFYNITKCFLKSIFMISVHAEHAGKGLARLTSYPFSELVRPRFSHWVPL